MESEEAALNLEVVCHEPLEELVQNGQGICQASIRSHDEARDLMYSENIHILDIGGIYNIYKLE